MSKQGAIWIITSRDVAAGAELCFDYDLCGDDDEPWLSKRENDCHVK